MIKVIFICFGTLFLLISTTVIFYWRDTQYAPNHSDLIFNFLLLPLGASLLFLVPYFVYKAVLFQREKKMNQNMDQEQQANAEQHQQLNTDPDANSNFETVSFKVYSSHILHALGEDDRLVQALSHIQAPSLDLDLSKQLDTTILSYRIAEIDDQLSDKMHEEEETEQILRDKFTADLNARLLRLEYLVQHVLQQHLEEILVIIDHIQRSKRFYHPSQNQASKVPSYANQQLSYEIERGWELNETELQHHKSTETIEYIEPLERFNIHLILPHDLRNGLDQEQFQHRIEQFLIECGIDPQDIKYQIHFMPPEQHLNQWINLLKQLSLAQAQCALCIAVDSDIDADYLNDAHHLEQQYVAAEFAASLCLSAAEQAIEGLDQYRKLELSIGESSISKVIERFVLDVQQFNEEQPCVLIAEKSGDRKTIQLIQRILSSSPIESDHLLYANQILGHSQNLAKLFSFVLMAQFDQSKYGLFINTQPLNIQAVISPAQQIVNQ